VDYIEVKKHRKRKPRASHPLAQKKENFRFIGAPRKTRGVTPLNIELGNRRVKERS
jgi:hypothetical protein